MVTRSQDRWGSNPRRLHLTRGPKCWVIDNGRWRSRKARSREGGCSKYPARPLVRHP